MTDAAQNTDRELWRESEGDYYAPSLHVTEHGWIGINVGGHVIVKPVREWHALAVRREDEAEKPMTITEDMVTAACESRVRLGALSLGGLLAQAGASSEREVRAIVRAALANALGGAPKEET